MGEVERLRWPGQEPLRDGALLPPFAQAGAAHAAVVVGALAAYVLLEWASFIHEYKGLPITPWNPGLGLMFALMVLGGPRYAVLLFAGAIVAEIAVLRSSLSWPLILAISAIIAAGYGLAATVARRTLRLDAGLHGLRDVLGLLATGLAGALLVAILLCGLLVADVTLDVGDVLVAARPLLTGDMIGISVVTPLMLRLVLHRRSLLVRPPLKALAGWLLYVGLIVALLWGIAMAGPDASSLFHLLFLPVVFAAVRHGLDGACASLAVTQLGLVGLVHGYGYDAAVFTDLQLLMLVLSATGLMVGVLMSEREHAVATVHAVEARLRSQEAEAAQAGRFNLVSGMAAALAHELNQPLTAARALARSAQELARRPGSDPARVEKNLAGVVTEVDHAARVVRRMRDFLRRGEPHVSTIDVAELLHETQALARLEAAARHIAITLDIPAAMPVVHGDRVQLQQVVLNLLRNAGETLAGRPGERRIQVIARALEAPARIEIAVTDNGPGIDPAVAERLFEPLTTSKPDGLGLGLSICASIVAAHGGRIWLHSGAADATEFRFVLPLSPG
jgi:two-component system sensor kinase FixL